MGCYQYTLRADTITVEGVEIGHYQYAYKPSWGRGLGSYNRMVARFSAFAERAADKLSHIKYVVQGEFKYAERQDGMVIYEVRKDGICPEFLEELRGHRQVGVLRKNSITKKFYIVWNPTYIADPVELETRIGALVGELNGGQFYINERGYDGQMTGQQKMFYSKAAAIEWAICNNYEEYA